MGYHFLIFRKGTKTSSTHPWPTLPGVSIVIAVKNGSDSLASHFKEFLSQEYPLFEIIIVNDHSSTEEQKNLEEMVHGLAQVTLYHSIKPSTNLSFAQTQIADLPERNG